MVLLPAVCEEWSQAAQLCVTMANLGATLLLLVQFSVLQKSGDRQTKKKEKKSFGACKSHDDNRNGETLCSGLCPFSAVTEELALSQPRLSFWAASAAKIMKSPFVRHPHSFQLHYMFTAILNPTGFMLRKYVNILMASVTGVTLLNLVPYLLF